MKKYLIIILLALSWPSIAGHQTKKFLVQFSTDAYVLDPNAIQKLNEVTEFLKLHPSAKIKLTGRTDFDGSIGYNVVLSRNRTNEVSDFLKLKGFSQTEIDEKWVGEIKPLATNANVEGKSMNRSVEIEITVLNYANTREWLQENQKNYEKSVVLKSSGQNRITTSNNTVIDIPANAFVDADGNTVNNQMVNVVIKEVNSKLDAIINQVYTTSGNELLETGGMINIEAFSNNTKLTLGQDKEISIQIPVKNSSSDMLVFEGVKDKNGNIDWQNTGVKFDQLAKQDKIATKLNEWLLQNLIDKISYEKPSFGQQNFSYQLPVMLKGVSKPRKPKMPLKPEARSLFSDLGWFFSTKSMHENRVAKVHKRNMDFYAKRMEKYNDRLAKYEAYLVTYKTEIEKFESAKLEFYTWVDAQRLKLKTEKDIWFDYHDKLRTRNNLTSLKVRSEKGSLFEAKPFNTFKHKAICSNLSKPEMDKLLYLTRMERIFTRLAATEFSRIVKDYSYNNSLKVGRLLVIDKKRNQNYISRPHQNDFLAKFIKANETDFVSIFGKAAEDDIKYMDEQRVAIKSAESQQYFVGNSKKMGWINCDRFVKRETVKVGYPNLKGACQVIILAGINSILNAINNFGADINFSNIPKNAKFKLLTFRMEGDQAFISVVEATATEGLKLNPEFVKMPIAEADKILAKL